MSGVKCPGPKCQGSKRPVQKSGAKRPGPKGPGAKTLPEPSFHDRETSSMIVTLPEASL